MPGMRHFEIRPVEPHDTRDVWSLRTRPEVARWLGGTPWDAPDPKAHGNEGADPDRVHALAAVVGGRVVGVAHLTIPPAPRLRHLGRSWLAVHPDHQRQGLGGALLRALLDAADRWLNLLRVEVEVHAGNEVATDFYARHGFVAEVRRARDVVRDGRLVDVLCLGRLRPGFTPPADVLRPPPVWPAKGRTPPGEIAIRPATVDDAAGYADLFREESVVWGTLQVPTAPTTLSRQRLAAPNRPYVLLAELGGRLAGDLVLVPSGQPRRQHVTGIGMGVAPEFQGMGVGDRLLRAALHLADDWLGCARVQLEVYPDNTRARRLYEKHGFVEEGARRLAAFRDGAYVDSVVMGRCRP